MMTHASALDFLRSNQPLPPDRDLSAETVRSYDEARRFFQENPASECIELFVNSFGEGDGFGVYPLIGDVLRQHEKSLVIKAIRDALTSDHRSVRYWSAQLAAEFPSPDLLSQLLDLLLEDDFDLKYAALTAVEQVNDVSVVPELIGFISKEQNKELRDLAREVVSSLTRE